MMSNAAQMAGPDPLAQTPGSLNNGVMYGLSNNYTKFYIKGGDRGSDSNLVLIVTSTFTLETWM